MTTNTKLKVCDSCRTAFYDEALIELDDEGLAEVIDFGADIGDHECEGDGCRCACRRPRSQQSAFFEEVR